MLKNILNDFTQTLEIILERSLFGGTELRTRRGLNNLALQKIGKEITNLPFNVNPTKPVHNVGVQDSGFVNIKRLPEDIATRVAAQIDSSQVLNQLRDVKNDLINNPLKAISNLLNNPNINQPDTIKALLGIISPEDKAQLQFRAIENLLTTSSRYNKTVDGKVVDGVSLVENLNSIPESNWNILFSNMPDLKENLMQLARIAKRQQKNDNCSGRSGMLYLLEISPLIIGGYTFLLTGKIDTLLVFLGLEVVIVGTEILASHWIANPNTAKLLMKELNAIESKYKPNK